MAINFDRESLTKLQVVLDGAIHVFTPYCDLISLHRHNMADQLSSPYTRYLIAFISLHVMNYTNLNMTIRYSIHSILYPEVDKIENCCLYKVTECTNKCTYRTIADHRRRIYIFLHRSFVDHIHLEIQRTIDENNRTCPDHCT